MDNLIESFYLSNNNDSYVSANQNMSRYITIRDLPQDSPSRRMTSANDNPEYIINLEDFLKLRPF